MHLLFKKYLISFCLIISMLANVVAQEKKIPFTWLDRSEKKLAGQITANLLPRPGEGLYELDFSVIWNDANGNPITETSRMPYLWLSKYDFNWSPDQQVRCTSFEKRQSNLIFQSADKLYLQVLNGFNGEVVFIARFQYALTRELYESGKSERVELLGADTFKMVCLIKAQKSTKETDMAAVAQKQKDLAARDAVLLTVADNYQKIRQKVREINDLKSGDLINRPNYLKDIEDLSAVIEKGRANLNPDSLPKDSFQLYRERYNHLNDAILELRSTYWRNRTPDSSNADIATASARLKDHDSLRSLIRSSIEPVVQSQLDSLILITENHLAVAREISTILSGTKGKQDIQRLDSLIKYHGIIRKNLLNLNLEHENTWSKYRVEIDGLMRISEIEGIHATFIEDQSDLLSAINDTDRKLLAIGANPESTPWYLSNWLIWIGLLTILILVVVLISRNASGNKKRLMARLTNPESGPSGTLQGTNPATEAIPGEAPVGYYSVNYLATIPESVVGVMHYHASSIKTVYHLVHSALQERNGTDFGGYLFGNQYKLHGKNFFKSEIFIEKACNSKYLRSSVSTDIGANADLVDELDELVSQNKKYRLIGWFTSCADNSMEISEGLMKIHRTFFKEKWQVGILLNPDSNTLQGAGFLRRKSGYLDPMPDPAAFLQWEDLYRFALDPVNSIANQSDEPDNKGKDYSRIELNNTWGDSIVTSVNIDLPVLNEITATAANQAIPQDTFQTVGYLYGKAVARPSSDGRSSEYDVYVNRFVELRNEVTPRDLPGLTLVGWWGQANVDVMNYLYSAVDYHDKMFKEAFQLSCLMNPSTGELRIFTRKHSLEMNNSTIETEEYSLTALLSR